MLIFLKHENIFNEIRYKEYTRVWNLEAKIISYFMRLCSIVHYTSYTTISISLLENQTIIHFVGIRPFGNTNVTSAIIPYKYKDMKIGDWPFKIMTSRGSRMFYSSWESKGLWHNENLNMPGFRMSRKVFGGNVITFITISFKMQKKKKETWFSK